MLKKKKNKDDMQDPNKEQAQAEGFAQTEETPQVQDETAKAGEEEKLQTQVSELNDKYIRLYAEFDNFKRRTAQERRDLLQTASKDVLVNLLPVLDDFERALKAMETASDVLAVKEGIDLIFNKFRNILSQEGLKEMESKGKAFDADLHEAITSVPAPSEDMKGKVIDEIEKGYFLNDKVIRFAKVVVGA